MKPELGKRHRIYQVYTMTLVFVCCFVSPVTAQILVGPTIGGQMNWVTIHNKDYKEFYSTEPTLGYHAGASVSFRMMKRVFLQTSILYSQQSKHLAGKKDQLFSNKVDYHFLDMPISFTKEVKMKFGSGKFYNLYFGVGPTIRYWLGGKGRITASDLNENLINPPDYDLKYKVVFNQGSDEIPLGHMNVEDPNRIQLGLNFSAGIVLEPIPARKFMFTVRYELGHSFFSPENDGDFGLDGVLFYEEDLQSRMHGAACSVFYFVDLKTEDRNKGKSTSKIKVKRRRAN